MKSGLGRITENTSQYEGVVVYSMNDLPLVWMHLLTRIMFFQNASSNKSFWFTYFVHQYMNITVFSGFWSGSQIHTRLSPCRPYDLGGLSSGWHRRIHQKWRGSVIEYRQHGIILQTCYCSCSRYGPQDLWDPYMSILLENKFYSSP